VIEWYLEQGNSQSFTEALNNLAKKLGCTPKEGEGEKDNEACNELEPSSNRLVTCSGATV
jgi:hypothetical protein